MIFKAVILSDGKILTAEGFPDFDKDNNRLSKMKSNIKKESKLSSELIDIYDEYGECKSLQTIEAEVLERVKIICRDNLAEVAKKLKIGRSTIYRKAKYS